ncbi:MAG: hypothetical protein WBP48_11975, partial [Microbacterium sp.]
GGSGAPGSFVAERDVDADPFQRGVVVAPHLMGEYLESAHALDASDDPRMAVVRERLSQWDAAASARDTVYGAVE